MAFSRQSSLAEIENRCLEYKAPDGFSTISKTQPSLKTNQAFLETVSETVGFYDVITAKAPSEPRETSQSQGGWAKQ